MNRNLLNNHADVNNELQLCNAVDDRVLETQITYPGMDLMPVCGLQNDRPKAQKAMEGTWSTMEKKEKIMWIKKAAEDQKRYEVRTQSQ